MERQPPNEGAAALRQPGKRPWYIYLMAIWALIGIGGPLSQLARRVFADEPLLLQVSSVLILGGVLLLIINLIKLKPQYIVAFGVLCCLEVGLQLFGIIDRLYSGDTLAHAALLLIYLVPALAFALLALRTKLLSRASEYRQSVDLQNRIAFAMKHNKR
ncbi:hypothetical protein [Pseudomonas sp. BC42]|uniref:hypothetical protein n=1 Tax=Pseudomonas sp. BC42 TaxID=2933816 RepID=UPI001F44891D|nr:hypothetical protein [Pseudomonas sp. BC42]ULT68746.1 hypothetical protein L1O02_20330 [Pseudomonas sp. BC42]